MGKGDGGHIGPICFTATESELRGGRTDRTKPITGAKKVVVVKVVDKQCLTNLLYESVLNSGGKGSF